MALKEAVEMLTGQRGNSSVAAGLGEKVDRGGDTMTGPLLLPDGTAAASTHYVDAGDRWVTVADVALTAVTTVDVTWTAGAYHALDVFVLGVLPAATGVSVDLYCRVNVGGSWRSGVSDYSNETLNQLGGTVSATQILGSVWYLTRGGTNAGLDEVSCRFTVDPGAATQEPGILGTSRFSDAATPSRRQLRLVGSCPTDGAVEGLQFGFAGSSFIASGRIIVMGLKA
jgi:hypothetical protein